MSQLQNTEKLTVHLGSSDDNRIIIHPGEGRKIDVWEQVKEFHLFTDMNAFADDTDDFQTVQLNQLNEFETGAIKIRNQLHRKLDKPDAVKLYRKASNIFLKPV